MKKKLSFFNQTFGFLPVGLLIIGLLLTVVTLNQSQDKRIRAAGENEVTITSVAADNSSAKVSFQEVVGAADYRIYEATNPNLVKYAGQKHANGSATPSTQIEWNLLGDGQSHTLIVQALDRLGPIPRGNQYNDNNQPVVSPVPDSSMLGANAGPTNDGIFSIDGQGDFANAPRVIAQSAPFIVRANSQTRPIPSGSDATQTFFDNFDNSEAQNFSRGATESGAGSANYTLSTGQTIWDILFRGVDTNNSMPFIADSHFMDMVFDGGTPGTGTPLHSSFGLVSTTPRPTIDFSNNRIAHLTMEIDSHFSQSRWAGFELSPANDPLTNWNPQSRLNNQNRGVFIEITNTCTVDFYTGSRSQTDPSPRQNRLIGVSSQTACNRARNGIALDNRSRFDLFISPSHIAVFEDGALLTQGDIPSGWLDFAQAHAYFTHYNIRTAQARQELQQQSPDEDFWISKFPYSDERHWDNMGFEVLPQNAITSTDWRSLSGRIRMPVSERPVFAVTPTPAVSSTPLPTRVVSPTPTVMPRMTVMPSLTPSPTPVKAGSGLNGSYYRLPQANVSFLSRVDPVIDFLPNKTALPQGIFRATWAGILTVPASNIYTFAVPTDGFARVFINERLLVNSIGLAQKTFGDLPGNKNIEKWTKAREATQSIRLEAGKKYNIRLEYFKLSGNGILQLMWSSPTIPKQIIPQVQLYPQ